MNATITEDGLTVAFHLDARAGSGFGHFSRCLNLAYAFERRGIKTCFYLSRETVAHLRMLGLLEGLCAEVIEEPTPTTASILAFCRLARIDVLVIDDYQFKIETEIVLRNKVFVVMIDDHLFDHYANVVLNHRPGLTLQETTHVDGMRTVRLGGERYCLARAKRREVSVQASFPPKILLHAGGSDLYRPFLDFFCSFLCVAKELGSIFVDILHANTEVLLPDELMRFSSGGKGLIKKVNFDVPLSEKLCDYSAVVGPAGTTTYETLIAGSLPLSFEVYDDGRDSRHAWTNLGHLFHLSFSEVQNPSENHKIVRLFLENMHKVAELLEQSPSKLDGLGPERAVEDIIKCFQGNTSSLDLANLDFPSTVNSYVKEGFGPCNSTDALGFLESRNSERSRSSSTHPDHQIPWTSHLAWWMEPNISRFKVFDESLGSIEGYFWIKKVTLDKAVYFTSGWFPSIHFQQEGGLKLGLKIMKAMRHAIDDLMATGLWIVTVRPENHFARKANQRFGFRTVWLDPKVLEILYPGSQEAELVTMSQSLPLLPNTA